jgi:hypothetical protein
MHRSDCTKFIKCSDNTINQCPGDTRFDYAQQLCNWPNNVECITLYMTTTTTPTTQSTTKTTSSNDPSTNSNLYFKIN